MYLSDGFNEPRATPHNATIAIRVAKILMVAIIVQRIRYLYHDFEPRHVFGIIVVVTIAWTFRRLIVA